MSLPAIVLPGADTTIELARDALKARRIVEALDLLSRAESAGYDPDECASGRWDCWMLLGEFERAWQESDAIAARGAIDHTRLWNQFPLEGKRVIIRCLHGFGDAIQFIRYARLLRPRVAGIVVETHPELVSLFSGLPWLDRVVTWADGSSKHLNDWDRQIEVMELPRAFRTTIPTVPSTVPYLSVSAEATARSKRLITGIRSGLKVGIVWQSSGWNPARSIPAAEFATVLSVPGISFFSFQRGHARTELSILRNRATVHDTAVHSPDISDTGADLMNMDLLITVDTMIAHLAGALGRNVWTILPFEADWRWMLNTSSSPWYPTMRLFRQHRPGDWPGVLETVIASLSVYTGPASGLSREAAV